MCGSATFTMVTSTSSMNVPRQTAARGAHVRIAGSFRRPVLPGRGQILPGALTAPGHAHHDRHAAGGTTQSPL